MLNRIVWALSTVALAGVVACGGGSPGAKSADDAEGGSLKDKKTASKTIDEGASVCIDTSLGNRRLVEDALNEAGFESVDSCMTADVMVREGGEPGAYELQYQRLGDADWATCESDLDDEQLFLETCTAEMLGEASVAASE